MINGINKIYDDIPVDTRIEKEMQTYKLLKKLNIKFERIDHEAAYTVDSCKNVEEELDVKICKNLFLCNRQKTKFYLLLLPGDKQFKTKDLSDILGISRLSFADSVFMQKFLNITPGSVSILGLMNDVNNDVNLLIDKDVFDNEYIGCHPCINTSTLKIKTKDIIDIFLKYIDHDYTVVNL